MAQNGNGSNTGNNTGGGGGGSPDYSADPNVLASITREEGEEPVITDWASPSYPDQLVSMQVYNSENYILTWKSENEQFDAENTINVLYPGGYGSTTDQTWESYESQEFKPPILTSADVQGITKTLYWDETTQQWMGSPEFHQTRADPELGSNDPSPETKTLWYLAEVTQTGGGGGSSYTYTSTPPSYKGTTANTVHMSRDEASYLARIAGHTALSINVLTRIEDYVSDIIKQTLPPIGDIGNQIVNTTIDYGTLKDES